MLASYTRFELRTSLILYTAHMHEEIKRQCMDAGMDDVLVKPVMTDALVDKITYWTQRPYFSCPRVRQDLIGGFLLCAIVWFDFRIGCASVSIQRMRAEQCDI